MCLVGDFNIHLDDVTNKASADFLRMLASFGLTQHVKGSTHSAGHCLDVVITKSDSILHPSLKVLDHCISDHYTLSCQLSIQHPSTQSRKVTYQSIKRIDMDTMVKDVASHFTDYSFHQECILKYNKALGDILDTHAPLKTRVVPMRKACKWYDDSIRQANQKRRQCGCSLELKMKRSCEYSVLVTGNTLHDYLTC
ncbi:hypothetical protein CAPTEDRAFT_192058 [Capitella teleta]|uniref:Endonuclease/exonuclease/phosphatase domain-containing protein n=1 Tax=Capitella teleta TaxID=283909 RepID=R7TZC4_CAPTE|nr:hypothetical protein CAPTEDRAFT_192058 [Capitella teleta]|eukprot:ELT96751.1 hypothetical protein CAPTEDRAFT_192058 [Capitella teleta]